MLANTLTLTINSVAKVLTRINQDNYGSEYRLKSATEVLTLQIRNSTEKATVKSPSVIDRHNMFFEHTVYAVPGTSPEYYYSMSAVMRMNSSSDPAQLGHIVPAFNTLLNAQAAAIIGGES